MGGWSRAYGLVYEIVVLCLNQTQVADTHAINSMHLCFSRPALAGGFRSDASVQVLLLTYMSTCV